MARPDQLPSGRHGLTRDQVLESQRGRMLLAMVEAVSENGYSNTPVGDILTRAGVSRETFYQHFANKEDCFLAAYDEAATRVLDAMAGALGTPVEPLGTLDQLDRMLGRYLSLLAQEPGIARTFLVEVYAAGDVALARRVAVQSRFTSAVVEIVGARDGPGRFACEALVASISGLVTQRVCDGRSAEITELRGPVMRLVVLLLEDLEARADQA